MTSIEHGLGIELLGSNHGLDQTRSGIGSLDGLIDARVGARSVRDRLGDIGSLGPQRLEAFEAVALGCGGCDGR